MLSIMLDKKINRYKCSCCCPVIEFCPITENCAVITFEGGGSLTPIPDVDLGFTIVGFPCWITTIDSDAGGFAQTANEPSPQTSATFVGAPDFRDITFTNPVSSIKLFYASAQPVTIQAYDENGNILCTDSGAANAGTGVNLPWDAGIFNEFDELSINIGSNDIFMLRLFAMENATAIDNLTVCVETRGLIAAP